MKTLVIKVDPQNPEAAKIQIAADIIREGGLVAFPTETVYGLGANALNADAVLRLFEAKQRPLDNPPIVHIADIDEVNPLVKELPKKAKLVMEKFWPGPLTFVLKRSSNLPNVTVAGLDSVAIRMPMHPVALALIKASQCPIAAPSANLAGKPSPTTAQHVYEDLYGRINLVLDGGSANIGVESTVLDFTDDPPMLLRPGGTPYEALKLILPDLLLHPFVEAEVELKPEKVRSPGMRHKHYAPKAQVILVEGSVETITTKIKELIKFYKDKANKIGVLATDETQSTYQADIVKSLGSRSNLALVAHNLFRLLREIDAENVDVIIAEGLPSHGLGLAVMNRLRKASGYHIIKTK